MKTFKWKRLVYAFLILGLLGACGNSNKSGETTLVNDNTDTIPAGTSGTAGHLTTVDQFITAISNGKFAAPQSKNMTFSYELHNGYYSNGGNSNQKCVLKGIICYSTYSYNNSYNNYYSNSGGWMDRILRSSKITRESADDYKKTTLLDHKKEILAKLKSARSKTKYVYVTNYYGQRERVKVDQFLILSGSQIVYIDNNFCYKIDLNKPLAANPTAKYEFVKDQCSGKGYELMDEYVD